MKYPLKWEGTSEGPKNRSRILDRCALIFYRFFPHIFMICLIFLGCWKFHWCTPSAPNFRSIHIILAWCCNQSLVIWTDFNSGVRFSSISLLSVIDFSNGFLYPALGLYDIYEVHSQVQSCLLFVYLQRHKIEKFNFHCFAISLFCISITSLFHQTVVIMHRMTII